MTMIIIGNLAQNPIIFSIIEDDDDDVDHV